MFRHPDCGIDFYFGTNTKAINNKRGGALAWLRSARYKCLKVNVPPTPLQSFDVERDIGLCRRINLGDKPLAAEAMGNNFCVRKISGLHTSRGFGIRKGIVLKSKDINKFQTKLGFKGLHRQRSGRQKAWTRDRTASIAFYLDGILPEWSEAKSSNVKKRIRVFRKPRK